MQLNYYAPPLRLRFTLQLFYLKFSYLALLD